MEAALKRSTPFLFQRLDRGKIVLGGLGEADARALAWKILGLYEKAYGRTAVAGINGDALGVRVLQEGRTPRASARDAPNPPRDPRREGRESWIVAPAS